MAKAIGIDSGKVIAASSSTAIDFNSANVTGITDLTVSGNLSVIGSSTTVNVEDLNVENGEITLNYADGDSSASANGAGIRIQDAVDASTDATILWDGTNDEFDFSHAINVTGNISVSGTVDGRDLATDGSKLDNIESGADVTDADNVTSSLVAATAITSGDKTTIQSNLGVDAAGTDNSTDVTLNLAIQDVFSLSTQEISAVDFNADAFVGWDDSAGKLTYLAGLDTDTSLGGGSAADTVVPSQLAVKTYVDNQVNAQASVQGLGINSGAAIDTNKVIVLNGSGAAIAATDNSEPYILGIISNSTAGSGELVNVYKEGRVIEWPNTFGGSPSIGDTLYLTTSAGLSKTAPTSGHVIRMGTVVTTGAGNKFFYKVEYVMSN